MEKENLIMEKEKLIVEILGSALAKRGFVYVGKKLQLYKGVYIHYIFERLFNGFTQRITFVDQHVLLAEKRAYAPYIGFHVYKYKQHSEGLLHFLVLLPKERLPKDIMIRQIIEYFYVVSIEEERFWIYENVEGLKSILAEFISLIEDYVFARLDKMSVSHEISPTEDMVKNIMANSKELSEKFIKENKLDVIDKSNESILRWFDIINSKIKATKDEPYQNVQDMLVEIASFLCEQLRNEVGGEWLDLFDPLYFTMHDMRIFPSIQFQPLSLVVGSWKEQDINWLREQYLLTMDSKLPVTQDKIDEINERMKKIFKELKNPLSQYCPPLGS